ncbi:leucyl aminopeptidase family protein [Fontisubflavum oceani]|uniref:leucyl aminopeptidase family protein n=1 Tax=Fontisubflavum oceani TaxID=2978973 RepID=UPI0025B36690|nr:leucyl aminopeptidase family protein [Fontisubflavum oceani]WJY22391.1 leucyl aminopeptidase family protein [Fontisubflavum oceani]
MPARFSEAKTDTIPIRLIAPADVPDAFADLTEAQRSWIDHMGFAAKPGQVLSLADASGRPALALIGLGKPEVRKRTRFAVGAAIAQLPADTYRIDALPEDVSGDEVGLGYLLSCYRFDRYRNQPRVKAGLVAPPQTNAARLEQIAEAEALTRDLINTPAEDMGPDALEAAMRDLAGRFGAEVTATEGEALIGANLPLIHTVGRAATRAPRLLDMTWGNSGPTLTLVGKGVCFDTGGLNLKPGASMGLMKKDMGGAATVLGLAQMIMSAALPLRLRVLIPAVENNVAGNAFRPGDILTARNGLTVEINNTDAEGRLVLADALALASETPPDLMISMATLTGAARVAVGPDLAPFYTDDDPLAAALAMAASNVADPVWRMPFHTPYESMIEPGIADLDNAPKGGFAGSITAALFLRRFVKDTPRYAHFDIYGWQPSAAPGRPKGGVGQGARSVFEALPEVLNL